MYEYIHIYIYMYEYIHMYIYRGVGKTSLWRRFQGRSFLPSHLHTPELQVRKIFEYVYVYVYICMYM
jgi:hypothetical protein